MTKKSLVGDTHNFGRAVETVEGRRLFKPRPLLWEWLVLSTHSPFRRSFETILDQSSILAKNFLPELDFGPGNLHRSGTQSFVTEAILPLSRLSRDEKRTLCLISGQLLALACWLGIEDLHIENLVLGRSGLDLKFGPIDIEIVFSKLHSPTETNLIPSHRMHDMKICGFRRILHLVGYPLKGELMMACLFGYVKQMQLISKNQKLLLKSLRESGPFEDVPIRYIIRPTAEYAAYLNGKKFYTVIRDLIPEEQTQLDRKEIPYFFRKLATPRQFYYYTNPSLTKTSNVSARDVVIARRHLISLLNLNRGWSAERFNEFLNEGTMLLFSSLDHQKIYGDYEFCGAEMRVTKSAVKLVFPDGPSIWADRRWRKHCGHIYLKKDMEKLAKRSVLVSI